MKYVVSACISCLFFISGFSQSNSFGLLTYHIPGNWQQQVKEHLVSYSGTEPETNAWVEIRVFVPEVLAGRPDSSFRKTWQRLFINEPSATVPPIKKRYNEAGLQVLNNVGVTSPFTEKNQKMVSQLVLVVVGNQVQPIQLLTVNTKDLKLLRPFIDSFIGSIDTVVKPKE